METTDPRGTFGIFSSLTVQDLIFLDDLRSLEVPWIDQLVNSAASHEDVGRVWTQIRCWGLNNEDAEDLLGLAAFVPCLVNEVGRIRRLVRCLESYQTQGTKSRNGEFLPAE
jgi:hypothetical protein